MRDTIFIQGLEARGFLGIEEWEQEKRQTIRIDLEMACDASAAASAEDIGRTVNYRSVAKAVLAHVEGTPHRLVETLAESIAAIVREEFGVPWVRVRVSKPGAVRFSESVGIVVERGRRDAGGR